MSRQRKLLTMKKSVGCSSGDKPVEERERNEEYSGAAENRGISRDQSSPAIAVDVRNIK